MYHKWNCYCNFFKCYNKEKLFLFSHFSIYSFIYITEFLKSYFIFTVFLFKFYFIFKLYNIVLVLPNIEMNPPQIYLCSPSWTLFPPPSSYPPFGSSQCTSPKHPVSCIEPGLATHFIHDIIHVWTPFSQILFLYSFVTGNYLNAQIILYLVNESPFKLVLYFLICFSHSLRASLVIETRYPGLTMYFTWYSLRIAFVQGPLAYVSGY